MTWNGFIKFRVWTRSRLENSLINCRFPSKEENLNRWETISFIRMNLSLELVTILPAVWTKNLFPYPEAEYRLGVSSTGFWRGCSVRPKREAVVHFVTKYYYYCVKIKEGATSGTDITSGAKWNAYSTFVREPKEKIDLPPERHRCIYDDIIKMYTK